MGRVEKVLFAWLVAMLVGVTATAGYVVVEHVTRCDRFDFSASEWRNSHGGRNEIAHRLVECHRLKGLRAQEVRARLGKPSNSRNRRGAPWSYDAGTQEGFMFPAAQTLEVEFSRTHVVRRARLVTAPD